MPNNNKSLHSVTVDTITGATAILHVVQVSQVPPPVPREERVAHVPRCTRTPKTAARGPKTNSRAASWALLQPAPRFCPPKSVALPVQAPPGLISGGDADTQSQLKQ